MKLQYSELNLKTKRSFTTIFFKTHNLTYETIDEYALYSLNKINEQNLKVDRRQAFFEMLISETILEPDLIKRFNKYLEAKINTLESFRLKFGDKKGKKKYKTMCKTRGEGNTLEGQIKKYGKEKGTTRHKNMNLKRAHTLENFVRLYGEEGKNKYESAIKNKGGCKLENMIKLYGEKEGKKRHSKWKSKCVSSEENFIKRHGEKVGKQKWEEFKQKSKSTKENFIIRHGKEEGEKRWKNYKESYGWTQASKQSLEIFAPLTKFALNQGIKFEDIFYGIEDSFEFKIENNNKLYSYDYTIYSLNLIFEFNGSHVHPSKEKLGDKWNDWEHAWTGESADIKFANDELKKQTAEKEGFTVIEIWDYEDKQQSIDKCVKIIESRM